MVCFKAVTKRGCKIPEIQHDLKYSKGKKLPFFLSYQVTMSGSLLDHPIYIVECRPKDGSCPKSVVILSQESLFVGSRVGPGSLTDEIFSHSSLHLHLLLNEVPQGLKGLGHLDLLPKFQDALSH